MSRSYKYPIYKERNHKTYKKLSNKRIRQYLKTLYKGLKTTKLRLLVDPWDICDWRFKPNTNDVKAKRK